MLHVWGRDGAPIEQPLRDLQRPLQQFGDQLAVHAIVS